MKKFQYPGVLTIAGFDGSGGAGIQADIKTISALGCYASSVLTALPIQNTQGVKNLFPIPVQAVKEQLEALFEDIVPQAIKIGMVHSPELALTITSILDRHTEIPVVFDPVMVATSGDRLMEDRALEVIIRELLPRALIITPNLDEAALLSRSEIKTPQDMKGAAGKIKDLGARNILVKGGHMPGPVISSLLLEESGREWFYSYEKLDTKNTHGSGCTLSSAIASYLALGEGLLEATQKGQDYVFNAIKSGADVVTGKGHGPLNHFFDPRKMKKYALD